MSKIKLTRGVLLFAVIAGLFIVGTSATITAQSNAKGQDGDFLDPISLNLMPLVVHVPVQPTPIVTFRQWIRIPYSPPVRSPFMPGN